MTFLEAALILWRTRGWLAIPLTADPNGFPKRPIVQDWTHLTPTEETVRSLPWNQALGLGIILGPASHNLAVIDVDDERLFAVVSSSFAEGKAPRLVRTIRKRGHLYVHEDIPSASSRLSVEWQGRSITIELKCQGTQVAAPPTRGYTLLNHNPPVEAPSIAAVWNSIARRFLPDMPRQATKKDFWQVHVPKEQRNNTLYVEAHKLRESGVSEEAALEMLLARTDLHYEPGDFPRQEAERTIHSAYRKGVKQSFLEDGASEIHLIP